jgi:hypothetical protein
MATDTSPAMLDLARDYRRGGADLRRRVPPDDPLPAVDAVVSVGHVLGYLPTEAAIDRAPAAGRPPPRVARRGWRLQGLLGALPVEVAASSRSRTRVRASYLRSKGPQYMDVWAPRR